jgi:hypothetical protein
MSVRLQPKQASGFAEIHSVSQSHLRNLFEARVDVQTGEPLREIWAAPDLR